MNDEPDNTEIYKWARVLARFDINKLDCPEKEDKKSINQIAFQSQHVKWHKEWTLSTFQEKSILYSLADPNQLINPMSKYAIQSLYDRDLIELSSKSAKMYLGTKRIFRNF